MTPKQILDSFSETLMQDERILSAQERSLIATLLQHARSATSDNPETQQQVRAVISSAVGEAVAQRAFSVLGGSIVEKILDSGPFSVADTHATELLGGKQPQPPGKEPQSPGKQPQPPRGPLRSPQPPPAPQPGPPGHAPLRTPGPPEQPGPPGVRAPEKQPQPPHEQPQPPRGPLRTPAVPSTPSQPGPPGARVDHEVVAEGTVAVLERPSRLPARCVVLDEFLAPQELEELTRFTLEHESDFIASEVVSPVAESGVVNYEHRRSQVLMDLGFHAKVMLNRIKAALPQVLHELGMEDFSIADVEVQITASSDGDFFHFHSDNGSDLVASRHLTFVYFFHREPRQFEGGELHIHDARLEGDLYVSEGNYHAIVPQQNQIVFFPCELMHEITPVKCPSGHFADSRFTVNGWLRR